MMPRLFISLLAVLLMSGLSAQTLPVGDWQGQLDAGGQSLPLVFHVTAQNDTLQATFDSPDQEAFGLPTKSVTWRAPEVTIDASGMGIRYVATRSSNGDTLTGYFEQGGARLPLVLLRMKSEGAASAKTFGATTTKRPRPQEPSDFPYKRTEVTIPVAGGGHTLAGTLTLPRDIEPKAAVILVSGSGPQNRDEALLGHKPFLVLADRLTRRGIAVLRYDDRGVEGSTGDFSTATTADFADDAAAAIGFLRKQKGMTGVKTGVIGHSEGGMIGPMVAADHPALTDFIVLLAGPGVPLDSLMVTQTIDIGAAEGQPEAATQASVQSLRRTMAYLVANPGASEAEIKAGIHRIYVAELAAAPEEERAKVSDVEAYVEGKSRMLTGPWFRYFMAFDPAQYLARVESPVLALNGSLDVQVAATENLAGIQRVLAKAGNAHVTVVERPGLNHLFQPTTTGRASEYATIETTFDEATLRIIGDWILSTTAER